MIVNHNVKHVFPHPEPVLLVLETEMVRQIAHVHMEHSIPVKLSAHLVLIHVKLVLTMKTIVKFV
jgi:hypothetical protein